MLWRGGRFGRRNLAGIGLLIDHGLERGWPRPLLLAEAGGDVVPLAVAVEHPSADKGDSDGEHDEAAKERKPAEGWGGETVIPMIGDVIKDDVLHRQKAEGREKARNDEQQDGDKAGYHMRILSHE